VNLRTQEIVRIHSQRSRPRMPEKRENVRKFEQCKAIVQSIHPRA
jgi:hypothetical protein